MPVTEDTDLEAVALATSKRFWAVGHPSTLVLPCTSRPTGESLLRVLLPKGMAGNSSDCEIMIDQARAIDNRRLKKRLGHLPPSVLAETKEKLRRLTDL